MDRKIDARRLAAYKKTLGPAPVVEEGGEGAGLIKTVDEQVDRPRSAAPPAVRKPSAGGLLKEAPPSAKGDSKYRKVAKLLVLIGQDEAAKILSKLDLAQVEAVTRELASIRSVSDGEAQALLEEFRSLFSSSFGYRGFNSGGVDTARQLLHAAFGPEKGDAFLKKAVPEAAENPFQFLEDFSGDQIVLLLKDDSALTVALVLSRLSAKVSASVLAALDSGRRLDVVRRIATLGKTSPEVLERVAAALREKARTLGRTDAEAVDGRSALAAILRHADPSLGDRLLGDLEEADPELGREMKERLYTLDDVVKADDRPIQERLRAMEDRDIALLLKGRSPEFIDKIKSNLSTTRRALVEEERSLLGPVPRRDVDEVAGAFLAWFRRGREEGRIFLSDDTDRV